MTVVMIRSYWRAAVGSRAHAIRMLSRKVPRVVPEPFGRTLYHQRVFCGKNHQEMGENSEEEQRRKANLGSTVEQLKVLVPEMLKTSLPRQLVSSDITLRICPTHFGNANPMFLNIKGHVSYYTVFKTLQFALTSLVLHPKVELHIESIKVNPEEQLQALYPDTTKIYVRWSTCSDGCAHLQSTSAGFHSTTDAKLGSHSWSMESSKLGNLGKSGSVTSIISQLATALTKDDRLLERVISGIFIFELNATNDQILVHTIEDVNIVEKPDPQLQVA